jgi:hypothetical protein
LDSIDLLLSSSVDNWRGLVDLSSRVNNWRSLDLLNSGGVDKRASLDESAVGVGNWASDESAGVGKRNRVKILSVGIGELLSLGEEDLVVDRTSRSSSQNNGQNDQLVHDDEYLKQAKLDKSDR